MESEKYMELAKKVLMDELNEMQNDVYQNLLRQGRADIDISQIKVSFHEQFPLVATSVANIQKWVSSGKVCVTIDAARGTTSSDEIRQSVCVD